MIKQCWCQGPDGLSVLDSVLGLCYHARMLQLHEPQTARCSCWGMVMRCPNPGAEAALCRSCARGECGALPQEFPRQRQEPCSSSQSLLDSMLFLSPKCCSCCRAEKFLYCHLGLTWSFFGVLSLQGVLFYHQGISTRGRLTIHPRNSSCDLSLIYLTKFSFPS